MEPGFVYYPIWEFKGHIGNVESGRVGYWNCRAWTQGEFSLCPLNLGCIEHACPWVDVSVYDASNSTWRTGVMWPLC